MLYKTLWCTLISVILAGCADRSVYNTDPTLAWNIKEQSTGPLPWITILPSENAQKYENVRHENISEQIRFALASFPKESKFHCVKFITLDYGEEEMKKVESAAKENNAEEPLFVVSNIEKEKSYYLKLGFYHKNPTLGGEPILKGKIQLEKTAITPIEAFNLLIEHLIEDIAVSPLSEISIRMVQ